MIEHLLLLLLLACRSRARALFIYQLPVGQIDVGQQVETSRSFGSLVAPFSFLLIISFTLTHNWPPKQYTPGRGTGALRACKMCLDCRYRRRF